MRLRSSLLAVAALTFAVVALAWAFGAPFADAGTMAPLLLGQVAGVVTTPAAEPLPPLSIIREDLPAFENVVASGRASARVPRYALTLQRVTLKLGGTTFTKAQITEIRLRLGSHVIFYATGSHLQKMNSYKGMLDRATFLDIDFTQPKDKRMGGEFIGGIDMSRLPSGELYVEVTTSGATAPTLKGKAHWGRPQNSSIIQKVLQFTWSTSGTGKHQLPLDFRGANVQRVYMIYGGTDWAASASAAAWTGNTGNGAMSAITVADGCKVGDWQLVIVEPGANVGTFILIDPDGNLNPERGVVASAFDNGSLAFTLADGATDFVAGDGFTITVADNSDGNVNRVEVKKDGRVAWDFECGEARFLQEDYGYKPQPLCYVVDFLVNNNSEGIFRTAGAKSIEWNVWLTASDTLTIYAEVLDEPLNN